MQNYWLNILVIDEQKYSLSKKQIIKKFSDNGIETRSLWYPNHLQKPFTRFQSYKISVSKKLFENYICLPSGLSLKKKEVESIINHI